MAATSNPPMAGGHDRLRSTTAPEQGAAGQPYLGMRAAHHRWNAWIPTQAARCAFVVLPIILGCLHQSGSLYGEQVVSLANLDAKSVNTICPVDGRPIDSTIAPITGRTRDGKRVAIGVCDASCAAIVRAHPDAFANDAVANTRHGSASGH